MSDLIKKSNVSIPLAQYISSNAYLNQTALDALLMVLHWVVETPTEDAVPVVHARWVNESNGYKDCSKCGCEHPIRDAKGYLVDDDYCPSCGARMDAEAVEA